MVEQGTDALDDHLDLLVSCLTNEHILTGGQRDYLRLIGFHADRRGTEFRFHFVYQDVILAHVCASLIMIQMCNVASL